MLPLNEFPDPLLLAEDPRINTDERINAAELHYPIIISSRGTVVDGRHRIIKARRCMLSVIPVIIATDHDLALCAY